MDFESMIYVLLICIIPQNFDKQIKIHNLVSYINSRYFIGVKLKTILNV